MDSNDSKASFIFSRDIFGEPSPSGRRQIFKLTGLHEKSPYKGLTFKGLNENDRRKLESSVLRAINIRQLSPNSDNSSVYHVFERLNTGGTPLSAQEIRNTVFRGKIVDALQKANKDSNWRKIIGKPTFDRRGRDIEIILRLMALYEGPSDYEAPMKRFLNDAMARNQKVVSVKAARFFAKFPKICKTIVEQLGERPFSPKGPLNVAILDVIFVAMAMRSQTLPANIKARITKLIANNDFRDYYSARTADTEVVKKRYALARAALK